MRDFINETGKFSSGQHKGLTIAEVASDGTEGMFYLELYIKEPKIDDRSKCLIKTWLLNHPKRCLECHYRGISTYLSISIGDWYRCLRGGIVEAHAWCSYHTEAGLQMTFSIFAERNVGKENDGKQNSTLEITAESKANGKAE